MILQITNILLAVLLLATCTLKEVEQEAHYTWFKGNTHTHTVLCGHADSHPDTVAMWYLERDYNFLILSEHNTFIDPDSVNLPIPRREDFILIPGEEITDYEDIHTTAMNIPRLIPINYPFNPSATKPGVGVNPKVFYMQKHVDSTRAIGGVPILNHPNFASGVSAANILKVDRLHMIELYNGHPSVYNWGNEKHASMEQKWDSLLTAGKKVYGVSSDDAHDFKVWDVRESNPGRGWVMVKSEKLTPDAITAAMVKGDFYASSGVMLSRVDIDNDAYSVEIDTTATFHAAQSPFIVGYKSNELKDGFWIDFISDGGEVLKHVDGISASMAVPENAIYLRAKLTYSRTRGNNSEQFFAWTQPVFVDKR